MSLLGDIITDLMSTTTSLTQPFLKTKVLATRSGNEQLLEWVNSELEGYRYGTDIPKYRIFPADITASYIKNGNLVKDQHLPYTVLSKDLQKALETFKVSESIVSIEALISSGTTSINHPLNASVLSTWHYAFKAKGKIVGIVSAQKSVSAVVLTEILSNVRSKLLTFMLELEKQFGEETKIEVLKENKTILNNIMNKTIINNSGDGNVINTGNEAQIDANITINKGNKQVLTQTLQEKGVEMSDITELISILDSKEQQESRVMVPSTRSWIKKLMDKAVEGSWAIGIGAAGALLEDVVKKYLGY